MEQFQVFEERSLEPVPLDDVGVPRADVVDDRVADRLLHRLIDRVVHVQTRAPVLRPVDRLRVLYTQQRSRIPRVASGHKSVSDNGTRPLVVWTGNVRECFRMERR